MSTRRVHQAPTFLRIDHPDENRRVLLEIHKLRPGFEVSIENVGELARGRIHFWDAQKKLFTVRWSEISDSFLKACGERTGLRSFFKVKLLSTQLVFRSELIRRFPDGTFQYRTPVEFFQSQRRNSLRIPMGTGQAVLTTPIGSFPILDLSSSGARIAIPRRKSAQHHQLESCTLFLGNQKISTPELGITFTNRDEKSAGCRFHGLNEALRIEIKQYLIQELHRLFKGGSR